MKPGEKEGTVDNELKKLNKGGNEKYQPNANGDVFPKPVEKVVWSCTLSDGTLLEEHDLVFEGDAAGMIPYSRPWVSLTKNGVTIELKGRDLDIVQMLFPAGGVRMHPAERRIFEKQFGKDLKNPDYK